MKRFLLFGLLALIFLSLYPVQKKIAKLPKELKEISGLEMASDSTLYAINDGGNEPIIYEINFKGEILRRIKVLNAKNIDWEDLCVDPVYREKLYIGDFGNNLNNRKNLCVYKINLRDIQTKNEVEAEKISFSYPDQNEFPPSKKNRRFDCEAMCLVGGKRILLFSKNHTKPYDGICSVYALDIDESKVELLTEIKLGKKGYFHNSVTAADIYGSNEWDTFFFLSTYSSIYKFKYDNGNFIQKDKIAYKTLTQKESLVLKSQYEIYVADEKSRLGTGGNLHKINFLNDKH